MTSPQRRALEGETAYKQGDHLAAAHAYYASAQAFQAAGDALNAAEMANNCSVAYLQAGEFEAALEAVEGTEEVFAKAMDLRRQGMAIGNRASALEALNRTEEAIEAYQQSAEMLKQAGEDRLRADVMQSLSVLQFNTGRQLQALASMQDGLEGIGHPTPRQRFIKRLLRLPFKMINRSK